MYPLARQSHWPQLLGLQGRRAQLEALGRREFKAYKVQLELRCGSLRPRRFARSESDDSAQGSQGPPGPIGSTGPQGIQGVQGPVGATVTQMVWNENCASRI